MSDELRVQSGQVVALRLFDIAYEIDLRRAEDLWARRTQAASARSRLVGTPPKAVSFGVPPLALELGSVPLDLGGETKTAAVNLRLYDFGIVAIALRLVVLDLPWRDFAQLANRTHAAVGPEAANAVWATLLAQLR